ncbi:MAG: glycosyltransferase family 39 protein [archaeon]
MNLKKNAWIIMLIILLLAILLRFWAIESESYWLDEAISIRQAQADDFGSTLDMVKKDIHLPLHITLLHFWVKIFGTSELASRLLSLIFGVAGVWISYLLTKKLFNRRIAIITSLLFAFSPIMIYYSQEARLYSLFVFLSLLSFYFYIKFIENMNNKNLLFYGLSTLLLIYTHLFAFLVLLVQNVYILYKFKFQFKKLIKWFAGQFILFLLFLPWISNLFKQVSSTLNTDWIPKPNIGIVLLTILDFFGHIVIVLMFLICLIIIIRKKHKPMDKDKKMLLVLWILLPFAIVLFYSLIISSVYNTRYLLFTVPALLILFSVLIDKIAEKKKYLTYMLVGAIILFSFISIVNQVNTTDKDDWRSVSSYIKENVEEEYIFINPFYHHDPFTYYFDEECFKDYYIHSCNYNNHNLLALKWDAICCNDSTGLTATDEKNTLGDYINETVWLISVKEKLYAVPLFDYFNENMNLTLSKKFGEIKISKFE